MWQQLNFGHALSQKVTSRRTQTVVKIWYLVTQAESWRMLTLDLCEPPFSLENSQMVFQVMVREHDRFSLLSATHTSTSSVTACIWWDYFHWCQSQETPQKPLRCKANKGTLHLHLNRSDLTVAWKTLKASVTDLLQYYVVCSLVIRK